MSLPLLDQAQLDAWAERAAPALADLGMASGTTVAVVARNRPELLVVDAAAASWGASVVHVDPDGASGDADRALAEAGPSVVVCEHAEQVPFVRARVPGAAMVVLGDAGAEGTVPWSQLVGDTDDRPSAGGERVLCDAHLSAPAAGDAVRWLLKGGAAVALAPPAADRQDVLDLRPTTLVTTVARVDGLARELRRRAPVPGAGDRHALGWAALAALPALVWAVASVLELGDADGRATAATVAALMLAVASLAFGARRRATLVVAVGALVALAGDAGDKAPSFVAAGRFTVATVAVVGLAVGLARSARQVAWARAVAAAPARRSGMGRFVAGRVRAALGLPACRRVLVVGGAPDEAALGELVVSRLMIEAVDPAVPDVVPPVYAAAAGEVG